MSRELRFEPESQTDNKDIEYVNIEIDGLPADADENLIKNMYFKNQHVVKSEPEINHVNGKCSGKAKVQIRCQNGLKSDAILKKLYNRGGKIAS